MSVIFESVARWSHWVAIAAVVPAMFVAVGSLIHTLFALRTKRRVSYEIKRAARRDTSVKMALRNWTDHSFKTPAERAHADQEMRRLIEDNIKNLTKSEQSVIREGLSQANPGAASRFAEELVSNALTFRVGERGDKAA